MDRKQRLKTRSINSWKFDAVWKVRHTEQKWWSVSRRAVDHQGKHQRGLQLRARCWRWGGILASAPAMTPFVPQLLFVADHRYVAGFRTRGLIRFTDKGCHSKAGS